MHYIWNFYQDDLLVETNDVTFQGNKYMVNENLYLLRNDNNYTFIKNELDYNIVMDFSQKKIKFFLIKENVSTEAELLYSEVVDKHDNITIIYKLDEQVTYKIVISLKE